MEEARELGAPDLPLFSKELIRKICSDFAPPLVETASESDAIETESNFPEPLGKNFPRNETGPPRLPRIRGDGGRGEGARSTPPGAGDAGLDTGGVAELYADGDGGLDHNADAIDIGPPEEE
jgi:hypothetical protein